MAGMTLDSGAIIAHERAGRVVMAQTTAYCFPECRCGWHLNPLEPMQRLHPSGHELLARPGVLQLL